MNTKEAIRASLAMPDVVWKAYVDDLSDEELLVRPVEGCNHVKWQIGHLISAEHNLVEQVCPGTMPALPDGFAEKYAKETAGSDDPAAFDDKATLLKLAEEQRAGTLAALDSLSDEDLDRPAPEAIQAICPNVGSVFTMQGSHWMMHAGQWAVLRRKLGRPPLF